MYFPMREGIKNLYSASAELQKIYNQYRRTGNTDRSERGDVKKKIVRMQEGFLAR